MDSVSAVELDPAEVIGMFKVALVSVEYHEHLQGNTVLSMARSFVPV